MVLDRRLTERVFVFAQSHPKSVQLQRRVQSRSDVEPHLSILPQPSPPLLRFRKRLWLKAAWEGSACLQLLLMPEPRPLHSQLSHYLPRPLSTSREGSSPSTR